jgi:hypothetical protein
MFGLNARGQRSFDISVVYVTLASCAVILRFICKHLNRNGYHLDDLWIVIALLFGFAAEACLTWGLITSGGGKEMKEILASGSRNTFEQVSHYLEVRPTNQDLSHFSNRR